LRWGVAGASWIAQDRVIPALRESGAKVVAVYSTDPERATAYSARNGIPNAFSDLEVFLRQPTIEAVHISSTNDRHPDQVKAAARAGLPILCEKPMATNFQQAREMVAACAEAGAPSGDRWRSGSSTPSSCRIS